MVTLLHDVVDELHADVGRVDVAAGGATPAQQALRAREMVFGHNYVRRVGVQLEGAAVFVAVLVEDEAPLEGAQLDYRRLVERRLKRPVERDDIAASAGPLGDVHEPAVLAGTGARQDTDHPAHGAASGRAAAGCQFELGPAPRQHFDRAVVVAHHCPQRRASENQDPADERKRTRTGIEGHHFAIAGPDVFECVVRMVWQP